MAIEPWFLKWFLIYRKCKSIPMTALSDILTFRSNWTFYNRRSLDDFDFIPNSPNPPNSPSWPKIDNFSDWTFKILKFFAQLLLFLELATFKIFELWEKWDVLIELHDISVIWSEFRIFRRNNLFWRLNFIFNHNEQMWFFDDAKTGK